jgi:hypothetical protein
MMRVTVAGQLRQFAQELLCEVLAFRSCFRLPGAGRQKNCYVNGVENPRSRTGKTHSDYGRDQRCSNRCLAAQVGELFLRATECAARKCRRVAWIVR